MDSCSFPDCNKPVFVKDTPHGPLCNGHYAQHGKGKPLTPLRAYSPRKVTEEHGLCPIEGCKRPSWHKAGYCQSHKKQVQAGEDPTEIRGYRFQQGDSCKIPGCSKAAKSRGYCASHYRQDWGPCKYPGCTRKMYNKRTGLCASWHPAPRRV